MSAAPAPAPAPAQQPAAPRLRRGVRLSHDATRGADLVLQPEGVLVLNPTAAAVLALCDGRRSVDAVVAALGERYAQVSRADVDELLARLAARRVVAYG
ncbi:pyrroloquinoline quinone biosynthesis peptide chaperone PqqD [Streptacidiphilus jiangxiensis]|uniref:Pyrroloquinoline quinone biosynthesis protein D n=1 Tax=Streptacidiphilus jiangxiensis TaxID=235985 RepID=A0A1H7WPH9_STRJI|nr:pyrroloquinoline quinone biosynthesis peptide chaperone PqqD [Streptacidiphilus jiangxiensis]SEM22949.1 pyrroloquinoline quinone biosynthesis protein D [Streptacidiphilus jiangxiensis]